MNGSLVQLIEGGIRGKRLNLKNRQSVTFGSCTVILRTEGFKPKQAIISLGEQNLIWFRNLDPASQLVKVNGVPVVEPIALKSGDEISFESCVCFIYEPDPAPTTPPPLMPSPFPDLLPRTTTTTPTPELSLEQSKIQEMLQPKKDDDSYQYINEQIIKRKQLGTSSSSVPTSATDSSPPKEKESKDNSAVEEGAETDDEDKKEEKSTESDSVSIEQAEKALSALGADEELEDEEEAGSNAKEKAHAGEEAKAKDSMEVDKEVQGHEGEKNGSGAVESGNGGPAQAAKKAVEERTKKATVASERKVEGTGQARVTRPPAGRPAPRQDPSEVRIKFASSEQSSMLQSLLNDGMTGQVNVSKDNAGGLTFTIHFPNALNRGRRVPPKQMMKRSQPQPSARVPPRGGPNPPPGGPGIKRKRSPPPARGQPGAPRGPPPKKPPVPRVGVPPKKALTRPGARPLGTNTNNNTTNKRVGLPSKPGDNNNNNGNEDHNDDDSGTAEAEDLLALADDDTGMFLLPNGSGGITRRSHRLAQQVPPTKKQRTEGDENGGSDDGGQDGSGGEKGASTINPSEGGSKAKRALAKLGHNKPYHHKRIGAGFSSSKDSEEDRRRGGEGGVGMTLLWAAEKVLREERRPMKSPEIIKKGREKGYIGTDSKRADNSLVGRFSTSITKDPDSPFVRVSPATYGLKEYVSYYKDMGFDTSES